MRQIPVLGEVFVGGSAGLKLSRQSDPKYLYVLRLHSTTDMKVISLTARTTNAPALMQTSYGLPAALPPSELPVIQS
jgi:hypothetical protein